TTNADVEHLRITLRHAMVARAFLFTGFYAGNEPVPFVTACRSHARSDKKPE
ncbi:unnamed protein product, partial [Ascophyllum nodosum]